MANSRYLWSVARALSARVRPSVSDSEARGALENSIRVLTTMANALEPGADLPSALAADESIADTDRLDGPAENAAAWRSTGHAIARVAGELDAGARLETLVDAIRWEKELLDSALKRIDEVERATPAGNGEKVKSIDVGRLQAYLRERPGCADVEIGGFRPVVGGRSRQTALFSVSGGAGLPPDMVIQRGIPGVLVGDAFLGEVEQFELLSRLHAAGMHVPRPVLVESDSHWLDAPFLLVERVPGEPVQPDFWLPTDSEQVVLDLAREMAVLHSQPVDQLGLGLREQCGSHEVSFRRAEIEALAARWHDKAHWPSITMSTVIAWLRANVDCLDDRRVAVHNDMVFHNILAHDDRITAVLDWEQCAIGHPGEDLGYCYPVVTSVIEWDRFMQAYRAAGGADVPQRQIDFFALRAGLRLMGLVMEGGRDTFERGLSDDVLVASAGAHFTQRLLHRIAVVLDSILERDK